MIAVDVMSGERPPEQIIKGALRAAEEFNVQIALVGDEEYIHNDIKKLKFEANELVNVYHANEVIGMHETPTSACKKKRNSSIMVCARLVKEGKAQGLFSPGNTGATLVASFMNISRVEGVLRPALATYIPTVKGASIMIDAGANMDCTSDLLVQFAIMGEAFANKVQRKKKPTVGLLSIGVEKSKGNEVTLKAHSLLKRLDLNFVGNIEGYDISDGDVDVVVCDGFVGNIALKVTERVFKLTFELVGQEIETHLLQRIGYSLIYPAVKNLRKKTDPREYGGAYLIGLNANVVIGHGSSDATTTYNGVQMVNRGIQARLNDFIIKRLDHFGFKRKQAIHENGYSSNG